MGNYEHGSSKKKKRSTSLRVPAFTYTPHANYLYVPRTFKYLFGDEDVKSQPCPVTTPEGCPAKCVNGECLWWDIEKDVCRVDEK